jgi:hypothetical protein
VNGTWAFLFAIIRRRLGVLALAKKHGPAVVDDAARRYSFVTVTGALAHDNRALQEHLGRVETVVIAARPCASKRSGVARLSGLEETDVLKLGAGRPNLVTEDACVDEPHMSAHRDRELERV